MYSKDVVGGGTGSYYGADNIWILGRQQEKDSDNKIAGYNFVINVEKSRFVKEKSKILVSVTHSDGINRWSGLLDADGDTYGDADTSTTACSAPDGYVADATDCDDDRDFIHPGAEEVWYDGYDENCDGASDYDADQDGQQSWTYHGPDCDDDDPTVYRGAPDEPYDGVISDCDPSDEYDVDEDGYDIDSAGGED